MQRFASHSLSAKAPDRQFVTLKKQAKGGGLAFLLNAPERTEWSPTVGHGGPASPRSSFAAATGWPTPRAAAACRTGITTASVLRRNSCRTAPIDPSWATPGCCRASVITTRPATVLSATDLKVSLFFHSLSSHYRAR